MKPAALHSHSEFSTRDSLIRADELPALAAERGWEAVALTDHGGIEGIPRFVKSAEKVGIKPIVGIELYVGCSDSFHWDKYNKGDTYNHLTVLAKNAKGFTSITRLLSWGHRNAYDVRRQKAIIPLDVVLESLDECVILSGCFSSPFWRGTEEAPIDLVRFKERFKDDFFLEVQPLFDWSEQIELNKVIVDAAQALNIPIVVTPDAHYGSPHEDRFHDALLAVADRKSIFTPNVWRFSTRQSFIPSPRRAQEGLFMAGGGKITSRLASEALEATWRVSERITSWSWKDLPAPKLPHIEGDLRALAVQGLESKGLRGRPEYDERLNQELDTFVKAGVVDRYLLLVRHCVELFKREGAEIGPRGSVGGSLVAYCLGITNLDPILHGLSYERWYAPGRTNMPDADLDLDREFRERVPDILRKEFGENHVAQISNYTTYGLRMAIQDAARAYGINLVDNSKFQDDKDILRGKDEEDIDVTDIPPGQELLSHSEEAVDFARKLVGRVRQYGAHAGGFVISATPLTEGRSAIVRRGKGMALTWDMEVAEELGFVKLDFLGIDTLSAIKAIGSATHIEWSDVPLDDQAVYKDISEGRTAGVPQFLTAGLRTFVEQLQPRTFKELVWANAAFRPGGLGQMTPRKLIEVYRRDPENLIIFQEDVMKLCVEAAGFTWMEADTVRKIAAKSKGKKELEKWRKPFIEGCVKRNVLNAAEADSLFTALAGWASYGFNASHSTAYTWQGYRVAWAKRHHPIPTFAALLNNDPEQTQPLLDEAPDFGVTVLPPHVDKSTLAWNVEENGIRAPLTMLPFVDLRVAKAILKRREDGGPFGTPERFKERMGKIKYPVALLENAFSETWADERFAYPLENPRRLFPKNLVSEMKECMACPLRAGCSKVVLPELNRTNVLIVGEAPGRKEDRAGRPFVGESGQLLMQSLEERGISREDVSLTNATHCFPGGDPNYDEKVCPWVHQEIEFLKPPLILAVGRRSWHKLGGKGPIMKANGQVIEIGGSKVVACVHPAAVLRDMNLLPELDRAIRKFAKLYRVLTTAQQNFAPKLEGAEKK